MKLEFNYQNSVITLPGAVLQKLDTASDADLRVLLRLAASEELRAAFEPAKLCSELNMSEKEIELSIAFWRGAGLLKTGRGGKKQPEMPAEEAPKEEKKPLFIGGDSLPEYTGRELEELMRERTSLAGLLKECMGIFGKKVFNVSESNKMISLVDYLHLSEEYIMTLCSYCKSRDKGSVAYAVATAKSLWNDDIVTVEQLEAYIRKEEERRDFENFMRHLLGLGGGKLTAQQSRFFENWRSMELPNEVISYAYEESVDTTGKISLPHINRILETYRKEGVKDLDGAREASRKHKEEMQKLYGAKSREKGGAESDFKSFDADDFFEAAKNKSKSAADKKV